MNIISFSLYGDSPKYLQGAIRNVELAKKLYPGWTCCFFFRGETMRQFPEVFDRLWDTGASFTNDAKILDGVHPLCWRFLAADFPKTERFIVRDADSRPSQREVDAVQQWIDSSLPFHTMRDHPAHGRFIHGGMWGAVGGFLPNIRGSYLDWFKRKGHAYTQPDIDQQFLEDTITPLVRGNCMQHDSFNRSTYRAALPFPSKRDGQRFVGEVWNIGPNGEDIPREGDYQQIPIEN